MTLPKLASHEPACREAAQSWRDEAGAPGLYSQPWCHTTAGFAFPGLGTRLTSDQGEAGGKRLCSKSQLPPTFWDSPGNEGLVCAVQLLGDLLPANRIMEAGFEGGLLGDGEGGVEVTSG